MKITYATLFKEMIEPVLNTSIMSRAIDKNLFSYECVDFRDFSENKHKKVDDYPFGGGIGMLLTPQPLIDCINDVKERSKSDVHVVALTPTGMPFKQAKAKELAKKAHICFVCGHYEGFDQRILDTVVDEEISLGDFVLTGGEWASLVLTESIVRLLDDAITEASHQNDSFDLYGGLLEYPQYTRPANFRGLEVPEILRSGNHKLIEKWQFDQALALTKARRPDLYEKYLKRTSQKTRNSE